ncbi:MAG: ATP-dependent Clp protease adaptor ClpS [Akkermansiaceae bacterium]|jgi:ATP-dependent Clp protease adaptor protein ClpS|nr:ATP-dependent Clp protease adaptor ClpS [Luteolibacter sp.]
MSDTATIHQTKELTETQAPWNVIVHDDPVNLMGYVTFVLMKIFGYNEQRSTKLMLEVHEQGLSVVWSGELEKAEFYAQQLQLHQLKTSIEISE